MKALAYLDDVEDELPNCQMLAPNELRLGDLTPSVISRYVVWSPTGLADNYDPLLTVLTNRHRVYFFSSSSRVLHQKWTCVAQMSTHLPSDPLELCRIHSVAWSPLVSLPSSSPWGVCLFALGAESGHVHLSIMSHSSTPFFKSFDLNCSWVVQLSFSSWNVVGDSATCLLSCSSRNGEIRILKIAISSHSDTFDTAMQELPFSLDYRPFSPLLAWSSPLANVEYLALVYPGHLFAFRYDKSLGKFCSFLNHNLLSLCSPSGVLFGHNDIDTIYVYILTHSGTLETFSLLDNSISMLDSPERHVLEKFLNNHLQNYGSVSDDSIKTLKIHGFCPSPYLSSAALHFSISYPASFTYVVTAAERSYFNFIPSLFSKSVFSHMITSSLNNLCVAPSAGCLLEISLMNDTLKEKTDIFTMLTNSLSSFLVTDYDFFLELKHLIDISSLSNLYLDSSLNAMRLLYGWSVYKQKALDATLLNSLRYRLTLYIMLYTLSQISLDPSYLTSDCKAVLRNFVSFTYKELAEVPIAMEVANEIAKSLEVSSDFSETCPACEATVQFNNTSLATCDNGHVWRRCSVTMLLLSQKAAKYCAVCNSIVAIFNPSQTKCLLADLQNELSICFYCGGHFLVS